MPNSIKIKPVTVITGGASGIGYSLAKVALQKGMVVFISDIEEVALKLALHDLQSFGEIYGEVVDVTKIDQITEFSKTIHERVSRINYLFNNAGVAGAMGAVWKTPVKILQHIFDVNVVGTINCLQVFVPKLLEGNHDACIINMSSNAGVTSMPYFSQYQITKHGIVTLSESLSYELSLIKAKIKVSVVCPGFVNTKIGSSSRNYPQEIKESLLFHNKNIDTEDWLKQLLPKISNGSNPMSIAKFIFKDIEKNKFYIFPHKSLLDLLEVRLKNMLKGKNAQMPSINDWAGFS
jgi:short-subunit dehydrogenase